MNNEAKQLNEALKELPEAKEYFELKEQLKNNEYVNKLLKVINDTQLEAQNALKNNDLGNYKIKQKELEILKDEFVNYPLIANFIVSKENLYQVLEQVVNIISEE